jgi:hypothetical protein
MHYVQVTTGYWRLEDETIDRTGCRTDFGKFCGPIWQGIICEENSSIKLRSNCTCVPPATRSSMGLRRTVYKLLDHVAGSGLFRRNTVILSTMGFCPNQSNLQFIMTLSWGTSSRNGMTTLNKMMRQWEEEQTAMLRHALLLLRTVEYYRWLFVSTILYSVPGTVQHAGRFKDGQPAARTDYQLKRWSYRYTDKCVGRFIAGCWQVLSSTKKETSYSDETNFCKPLKNNSECCPFNQASAAAMTSASDEKWRPFNCFFSRVGLRTYQHPFIFFGAS